MTDNPYKDFDRWDAAQQAALDRLPRCDECGEPIQDEFCFDFGDSVLCEDCLMHYRRLTENLIA